MQIKKIELWIDIIKMQNALSTVIYSYVKLKLTLRLNLINQKKENQYQI